MGIFIRNKKLFVVRMKNQNRPSEDSDQNALIRSFVGRTCPKVYFPGVAALTY